MIRAQFNRDGSFRSVTMPGRDSLPSSPEHQWAIAWLELHGVNPGDVPLGAVIPYDATFDEWRIPTHCRDAKGSKFVRDGGIAMCIVRRRVMHEPMPDAPMIEVIAVPA